MQSFFATVRTIKKLAGYKIRGETPLTYDDKGKITSVTAPDHSEAFTYDEQDNTLDSKTVTVNGITHTYEYGYKPTADKALDSISVDGNTVRPNTDALGRNTGKVIEVGTNKVAEEKLSYVKFGDHATNMPSNVRFATNGVFNESIQYKYNSMGNIIEVFENGRSVCRYEYDSLGRLTREDNVAFAKTTTWAYDNNGNILAKYEYELTAKPTSELHLLDCTCINYAYDDNSDQLMSYNGEAFVYDTIGNPTTYRGKAAVWEYGRQLKSYDGNTFAYDARGRRTAKNGITFTYDSNGNLIKQSNGLEFLYDHTGVFAVKYNGSTYFYRKNAQQDVIALLDNNGSVVVKYKYDAWGKCDTVVLDESATEIANFNPFRYRSYYFDTETNLYFLKTRYYDPEIGRFITIDDVSYLDPESINGLNLYAYCGNNPISLIDSSGNFAITTFLVCLGIGILVGGTLGGLTAVQQRTNIGLGILTGALLGGIIGAGIGVALGATAGGGFVAFINHSFVSSGIKAVSGKFIADLTANVLFDKPMGNIVDYMSAFAFGGISGLIPLSNTSKVLMDIFVRPAYNIAISDVLFKGTPFSHQKYVTNVIFRSMTAGFSPEFKPFARGLVNGIYYQKNNGGLFYLSKYEFDLLME